MMTTRDNAADWPTDPDVFVKAVRMTFKLTQRDLAERLGVHPRSVSNWETGTVTPTQAKLDRLRQLAASWEQGEEFDGFGVANAELWRQALNSEVHPGAPAGLGAGRRTYLMMLTTHRPGALLMHLRTLKRRVDAISVELESLIGELEQSSHETPLDLPTDTQGQTK